MHWSILFMFYKVTKVAMDPWLLCTPFNQKLFVL